jgi:thiamine kinase-like enzyme
MLRLWTERHRLSDALEALPQTFCHLDAIRNNLVLSARDDAEQTIALDWEWTGIAGVGEELAPLVAGSLAMLNVEASHAGPLDTIAFPAYLEGLRAAGWQGPADAARFGYVASAALRFGLVWGVWLSSLIGGPENRQADVAAFYARDLDAVLEHFTSVLPFLLDFGDEALNLLPSLHQEVTEASTQ